MPVDRRYGFDMILILIQYIWGWVLARWGGVICFIRCICIFDTGNY